MTRQIDISKVKFEEEFVDQLLDTMTLYFIAPKEWLDKNDPEAVHSEICVEYRLGNFEPDDVRVSIAATRIAEDGAEEDYDWQDITLDISDADIYSLVRMANGRDIT